MSMLVSVIAVCTALLPTDNNAEYTWSHTCEHVTAYCMVQVFKPFIPFIAAWLAASSLLHFAPVANCFFSVFVFLVCMSQQFHAWGHMKKSELPQPVIALQVGALPTCCRQLFYFAFARFAHTASSASCSQQCLPSKVSCTLWF